MIVRLAILSSIVLAVTSLPTFAQDIDCKTDTGSYVTQYCTAGDLEAADKQLNSAYKRLMQLLGTEQKASLKEVQRGWIKYRNAVCVLETTPDAGTTGMGTRINECHTRLTRNRTEDLNNAIQAWSP